MAGCNVILKCTVFLKAVSICSKPLAQPHVLSTEDTGTVVTEALMRDIIKDTFAPELIKVNASVASTADSRETYAKAASKNLKPNHAITSLVKDAFDLHTKEENDKEQRECNLIIHRAQESKANNERERSVDDEKYFNDFCSEALGIGGIEVAQAVRLGKWEATKNRPLRITLTDKADVRKVHLSLYKLRDAEHPYCDVSIAHDLTVAEREELKKLVAEAKENTQYDMSGNWDYKVRSRGPHWDPKIVKLKKRGNAQIR